MCCTTPTSARSRKTPLCREVRVSSSLEQMTEPVERAVGGEHQEGLGIALLDDRDAAPAAAPVVPAAPTPPPESATEAAPAKAKKCTAKKPSAAAEEDVVETARQQRQ